MVFLHEVREVPASQSYGLAVAQLACVAPAVVRRARTLLMQLEERALGKLRRSQRARQLLGYLN